MNNLAKGTKMHSDLEDLINYDNKAFQIITQNDKKEKFITFENKLFVLRNSIWFRMELAENQNGYTWLSESDHQTILWLLTTVEIKIGIVNINDSFIA